MARLRLRSLATYVVSIVIFLLVYGRKTNPLGRPSRSSRGAHHSLVVRTLKQDLESQNSHRGRRPRIAIISYDVAGPLLNGGIGTAYTNLACALGRHGFNVTLVMALGAVVSPFSTKNWEEWIADFRKRCSVILTALPASRDAPATQLVESERSYAAYSWLKEREQNFNVVHFHEWRGIGYHSQLAKHQGLHFLNVLSVIGTHSPSVWSSWGNMVPPSVVELQIDYLERESVRFADVVVSPSHYMIAWMRRKHWQLPKCVLVYPNIVEGAESVAVGSSSRSVKQAVEFVFFGRLEARKGLDLFVDAMLHLRKNHSYLPAVTLLGKISDQSRPQVQSALRQFAHWHLISNFSVEQAGEYLSQAGRIAVISSLSDNSPFTIPECMAQRIPFLASDVGGNAELVYEEDQAKVLFKTDHISLARSLLDAKTFGVQQARTLMPFREVLDTWIKWHSGAIVTADRLIVASKPRVSIVIAIYLLDLLSKSVESALWQSYDALELVLVSVGLKTAEQGAVETLIRRRSSSIPVVFESIPFSSTIGRAWNSGRRKAGGSVLVFMENDAIRSYDDFFLDMANICFFF